MKSPEDIENVLGHLGRAWPDDGSIAERVMREIEAAPPAAARHNRRRILMKSLLAIAASLAACLAVWWAVDGSHNSLYAQVIDGARKAQTIHIAICGQLDGKTIKTWECWYKSGVGFRRDSWDWKDDVSRRRTICLGNKDGTWTLDVHRRNTIVHSSSPGISKDTEQIFADIDRHARDLQSHGQRFTEADQTLNGESCKAYLSGTPGRNVPAGSKTDNQRQLYYLDPQSRLVRVTSQEREGDRWNTTQFNTIAYDEPLDVAWFQPQFGKEFQIVETGPEAAKPETKPKGAVLVYQVDPKSVPVGATIDMDRLLRAVDLRLNGGNERLAAARKLDGQRIEVTLMRRDDADRRRVERQLARPGTLEFRVLASRHVDKALIDRAEKEPAKGETLDSSGKRVAWWVPVKAGSERNCTIHQDVVKRTKPAGNRELTEILVVADPDNVTGAYLTQARLEFDRRERPAIGFRFNDAGGKLFAKLTGDHLPSKSTDDTYKLGIIIDGELFSAPSIQCTIHDRGEIAGQFTEIEASDLAAVLKAGSLPVRLQLVEEHPRP